MNSSSARKLDTVKVNPKLRKEAETVFNNVGLTLDQAVNVFLTKSINSNGMPFELKEPLTYKQWVTKKLKEAENDILNGVEPLDGEAVMTELGAKYGI
jgi:DNA-damage-inducible protein J